MGAFGCSLILKGFWQHSVKTDNAALGSSGLYRIIVARCINLVIAASAFVGFLWTILVHPHDECF